VLALIGVVVLLVTGSVLRLLTVVALVVHSVAAGRVALAKDLAPAPGWTRVARSAGSAAAIGMAGGDGSQALVADVARRHDIPFVCGPAGTRNHFALDLGLGLHREDVAFALDAYGDAFERCVDLALLGDRVFVNNASLGVYATSSSPTPTRRQTGTTAALLPDLLGPSGKRSDLRFTGPDGTAAQPADVVLISNGAYAEAAGCVASYHG
jgi:diacylglycerol kinase family enzyme